MLGGCVVLSHVGLYNLLNISDSPVTLGRWSCSKTKMHKIGQHFSHVGVKASNLTNGRVALTGGHWSGV